MEEDDGTTAPQQHVEVGLEETEAATAVSQDVQSAAAAPAIKNILEAPRQVTQGAIKTCPPPDVQKKTSASDPTSTNQQDKKLQENAKRFLERRFGKCGNVHT